MTDRTGIMGRTGIDRRLLLAGGLAALAGCSQSRFLTYDGPQVTSVVVQKAARRMYLYNGQTPLRGYNMQLGFAPVGHKQFEGDGKTPEGQYIIDRRNPNSEFHLSLGISYPNAADRAFARSMGRSPGGDIFIHGTPRRFLGKPDWTAGCVAIHNREIEQAYSMVEDGTPIFIYP